MKMKTRYKRLRDRQAKRRARIMPRLGNIVGPPRSASRAAFPLQLPLRSRHTLLTNAFDAARDECCIAALRRVRAWGVAHE
jgi:hypothetical protein